MSTGNREHLKKRVATTQLGFWIYLMTDLMLFSAFFATYMVLRHGVNGGVGPADTVSYTHLDVYKRQALRPLRKDLRNLK